MYHAQQTFETFHQFERAFGHQRHRLVRVIGGTTAHAFAQTHVGAIGTHSSGNSWGAKRFIGESADEAHKYRALRDYVITTGQYDPEAGTVRRISKEAAASRSSPASPDTGCGARSAEEETKQVWTSISPQDRQTDASLRSLLRRGLASPFPRAIGGSRIGLPP